MLRLTIPTRQRRQIIDISAAIEDLLREHYPGESGICHLNVLHTTAAITTADLDPGTDLDMLDAFAHMIPKLAYRHPHNPAHVPDHILSSLLGTSLSLLIENGSIVAGVWQRVVLIECDGPRDRELAIGFSKTD